MRTLKLRKPFPMVRRLARSLPATQSGHVFVWDVDKTYLDTHFTTKRGMMRVAVEPARSKRAVPGAKSLIRALRTHGGPSPELPPGLFFITASPPQIGRRLEGKLRLDGIDFDGITYKDQARLAARMHGDQLRVQAAYKLSALLSLYREVPEGCDFVLFGDDVEHDAAIYTLFADITAGRIDRRALEAALRRLGVRPSYVLPVCDLADELPRREAVSMILIHLYRQPDGASLHDFDDNVVGYASAGAAARHLGQHGILPSEVVDDLVARTPPRFPIPGARTHVVGPWTPGHLLE